MSFPGPHLSLFPLEEVLFPAREDLIDVALPDISPARLFMNRPDQILEGNEALFIGDEPEFIGPVAQHIIHEATQRLDLDLCLFLTQYGLSLC